MAALGLSTGLGNLETIGKKHGTSKMAQNQDYTSLPKEHLQILTEKIYKYDFLFFKDVGNILND